MFVNKIKCVPVVLVIAAFAGRAGLLCQTQAADQPKGAPKKVEEKPVPAQPTPQPATTDRERMVGNWFIINDDSLRQGEMWVITEDSILMHAKDGGANAVQYAHRLDASNNPKQIDITVSRVNGQTVGVIKGIYVLNGDELRLCLGEMGKDRPAAFSEKRKPGEVLVLRRESSGATPPTANDAQPEQKMLTPEESINQRPKEKVTEQFKVTEVPSEPQKADKERPDGPSTVPEEKPKPANTSMNEYKPITVYGQVIDDETGKPVTSFDTQGGHVDEKDPKKVTWGYWLRPNAGGSEGRFDVSVDWNAGWRARVVASGYLPQPIVIEPPKQDATKVEGVVVHLKRGRAVSGRVVDHDGKPVKDAALFVVGSRPLEITGGHALMNSSHGLVEDRSAARYTSDAEGRFTLAGIGEDARGIAVSCRTFDLWIVPAPATDEAAKDFEIRLPEPGKLIVHYDIPGAAEETTIFLQFHTWDREGWKGVDNWRRPTVMQHGELVLDNITPGLYEVVRESGGFLDRRQVTIEPGKTVMTDFIRKAGAPITGRVVGLDREEVQKAKPTHINISVHKPGEERNPIAPRFAAVQISAFDKDGKPSDGSFKTETIPPGKYVVRASVFIEETPEQRYRTGILPPGFEGDAMVTVPEEGAPAAVEIQLKKWVYQPFEFKKTEPVPRPETPKSETPKESTRQDAYDSAFKRGLNSLAEPPSDKGADDAVKQGLQAIGNKQNDDEAS